MSLKEYRCCLKFRRGDNSTYTFTKRGVVYLVSTTPPKRLIGPLSFRESTSWIISPSKFWTATIFLHAHLQVVYYNCVKFHKNSISRFRLLNCSNICFQNQNHYTPRKQSLGVYRDHPVRPFMYLVSVNPQRLIGFLWNCTHL
jgi:hypothetical protein